MTVALLLTLLSGCTKSADSHAQATPAPTGNTPLTPTPDAQASAGLAAAKGSATGDLIISLLGDCHAKRDGQKLLIELEIGAGWIGGAFPATSYQAAADRGGQPVRGQITGSGPFKVLVGGDSSLYSGRDITVTLTIDPDNKIAEFSETNNVTKVVVTVPPTVSNGDLLTCA